MQMMVQKYEKQVNQQNTVDGVLLHAITTEKLLTKESEITYILFFLKKDYDIFEVLV